MANYDRSAQKQEKKGKKGKKGGGEQQPARKRKHYSDRIPMRKLARMLQSCGARFVAEAVFRDLTGGGTKELRPSLGSLAEYGEDIGYGPETQKRAKEALEHLAELKKKAGVKCVDDDDEE